MTYWSPNKGNKRWHCLISLKLYFGSMLKFTLRNLMTTVLTFSYFFYYSSEVAEKTFLFLGKSKQKNGQKNSLFSMTSV